jgi:hypothetical protein
MSDEYNQNERVANELERVLMSECFSQWTIKKGLECGYEARLINPDLGCVAGNVVWGLAKHLNLIEEYWNGEIGKLLPKPKPTTTPPIRTNVPTVRSAEQASGSGKVAYDARAAGAPWATIHVKSALNAAKSYAKTHGLPWPPKPCGSSS